MFVLQVDDGWVAGRNAKADAAFYEEVHLKFGYRIDLVVEDKLVVEIKSCDSIRPIFIAQTLTYMRLGGYKLGLIINFNVELLRDGIKRVINGTL
jgi:GxxExxY protein